MFLKLVDDHALIVNVLLWCVVLIVILLVCITIIKLIKLCFTCHMFCNRTVYSPIKNVYHIYQSYMHIDPFPKRVIDF